MIDFFHLTNSNEELRQSFDEIEKDIETGSKKWLNIVKDLIKKSFKKVRIKKNNIKPSLQMLFQRKEKIKADIAILENLENFEEVIKLRNLINSIDDEISNQCADKNRARVQEYLGEFNDENFSQVKTWAL